LKSIQLIAGHFELFRSGCPGIYSLPDQGYYCSDGDWCEAWIKV